jgi:hypothetical protein
MPHVEVFVTTILPTTPPNPLHHLPLNPHLSVSTPPPTHSHTTPRPRLPRAAVALLNDVLLRRRSLSIDITYKHGERDGGEGEMGEGRGGRRSGRLDSHTHPHTRSLSAAFF